MALIIKYNVSVCVLCIILGSEDILGIKYRHGGVKIFLHDEVKSRLAVDLL